MEWVEVTTEKVRKDMAVEISAAYDKWVQDYPEKAGRLEEIVEQVRTEFRDAIAAKSKNWLHPDKTYLPLSLLRHCENIIQYMLGMEIGVELTVDGRTLLTRADMALRQIIYGHSRFTDENDTGELPPSYSVPSSSGRALGNLVAWFVAALLYAFGVARAAWIKPEQQTTYVPVNYDITEQSLNGHLAGIDAAMGFLSDTNSLYGDLVALPAVVYNLMDVLKSQALYGEYREDAGAWVAMSQTNVIIFGTMAVNRLVVREGGATIHGNAEILEGGLDVDGDVTVGGGITMGGVRRDSWPPDVSGQYLPVTWEENGTAVVSSNVAFSGLLGVGRESVDIAGGINANVEDAVPSSLPWLYSDDLTIRSNGKFTIAGRSIHDFAELTNGLASLADLDALTGELVGPAYLTPARFEWDAAFRYAVTTNTGEVQDNNWSILTRPRNVVTLPSYSVVPLIQRNQWDAELAVEVSGPAELTPLGDGSYILYWNGDAETGDVARVTGQLGGWRASTNLLLTSARNIVTQELFAAFASGSVREALAEVLASWTNKPYGGYRFANYATGALTNWEQRTNGYVLASHCWEEDADLSGVSFLNDTPKYWWTQPGTLVSSNLVYGAAHWTPGKGSRWCWMGKDGEPHAATIIDQRRMTDDLCLSLVSPPLDTNVVTAYPILDLEAALHHTDTGRAKVYDLPPLPVLAMAQGQRAWIMTSSGHWDTEGTRGYFSGVAGIFVQGDGEQAGFLPNSRQAAVGGDSGHPCFATVDGTNLVLLGSYWTPNGISTPGSSTGKSLVLQAAQSMGADTNGIRFEQFADWPTYLGPGLNMGGGSNTQQNNPGD